MIRASLSPGSSLPVQGVDDDSNDSRERSSDAVGTLRALATSMRSALVSLSAAACVFFSCASARAEPPSVVWILASVGPLGGATARRLGDPFVSRASVIATVWIHPVFGISGEFGGHAGGGPFEGLQSTGTLAMAHLSVRVRDRETSSKRWSTYAVGSIGGGWMRLGHARQDDVERLCLNATVGVQAEWRRSLSIGGVLGGTWMLSEGVTVVPELRAGVAF